MTIYEVVEYITEDFENVGKNSENASGMYSSIEKARQATLTRIAEMYTEEAEQLMNSGAIAGRRIHRGRNFRNEYPQ